MGDAGVRQNAYVVSTMWSKDSAERDDGQQYQTSGLHQEGEGGTDPAGDKTGCHHAVSMQDTAQREGGDHARQPEAVEALQFQRQNQQNEERYLFGPVAMSADGGLEASVVAISIGDAFLNPDTDNIQRQNQQQCAVGE